MKDSETRYITAQDLSNLGLIYKINKEILHPLGLALGRDRTMANTNSEFDHLFCVAVEDAIVYSDEAVEKNEVKLKKLDSNLKKLKKILFKKKKGNKHK